MTPASHRYAVMHLGGRDPADLEHRCRAASRLLGWPAPYAELGDTSPREASQPFLNPAPARVR